MSAAPRAGHSECDMRDRIRPLEEVTQTILDAELAELKRLAEEARARQDEISRLGAAVAARSAEIGGADAVDDLAFQTGQDARWQAWVSRAQGQLKREAAEAAARREAQFKKAQKALGQVDAVARIRALDEDARRQGASRRLQLDPEGTGGAS